METSSEPNAELRKATIERKRRRGYRCIGRQRDGNYALSVGIPTACFTPRQLRQLAEVVDKYATVGHFSTAQGLIIVGIKEENFYEAKKAVIEAGFDVRSIGRDVRQVKCCPGADFSPFGMQRTFPVAADLEATFRGLPTPMKFKISVSGCPNCCANTKMNDFGIHGVKSGWRIFVGGKMGNKPVIARELVSSVTPDDVAKYLAAVLRVYREQGGLDERLAATIERMGFATFRTEVEGRLHLAHDDLAREAREAREEAERCECIGPSRSEGE